MQPIHQAVDHWFPYSHLTSNRRFWPSLMQGVQLAVTAAPVQLEPMVHPRQAVLMDVFGRLVQAAERLPQVDSHAIPFQWSLELCPIDELEASASFGRVRVTTGAIDYLEWTERERLIAAGEPLELLEARLEAQLAFVLAHEMTHSLEYHPCQQGAFRLCVLGGTLLAAPAALRRLARAKMAGRVLAAYFLAEGFWKTWRARKQPNSRSILGASAVLSALLLAGWSSPRILAAVLFLPLLAWTNDAANQWFSRRIEFQADRGGLRLMREAGFAPDASVRFFESGFVIDSGETWLNRFNRSHPPVRHRLQQLQSLLDR
jgi:hypothetical protein